MLTLIKQISKYRKVNGKQLKAKGLYLCDCGNTIECQMGNAKSGHTKSCGCLNDYTVKNVKHGFSRHPLYISRRNMISRCYNPKDKNYKSYGGAGVRVCDLWLNDMSSFYKWAIDNGWEPGMQIDKDIIPQNMGIPAKLYSPEMCSIVTAKENVYAQKRTRKIIYNGNLMTVTEFSEKTGISDNIIDTRLRLGWSVEKILSYKFRNSRSKSGAF